MNIRLKTVSNVKEQHAGLTIYYMRRISGGQRYGNSVAISDVEMPHRDVVAMRLRQARRDLRDFREGARR
jgi:hypothetical protein